MAPAIAVPPLYHWLPVADDDVSTVLPPVQKLGVPLIVGCGGVGVTVTVVTADAGEGHPPVVTTTV